jgi:hypothetical protein
LLIIEMGNSSECGRSYIGETGRPLAVGLREQRRNLKEGLLEKSKLAQHASEQGHKVGWDKARILDIESHSRYRKYKEATHMACSINRISQPSLDIFLPTGSRLSALRLTSQRENLYDVTDGHGFTPQMALEVGTVFTSSSLIPHIGVHGLVSLASFVA